VVVKSTGNKDGESLQSDERISLQSL